MCGIAGILSYEGPVSQNRLLAMSGKLAHRGPDGDGVWTEGNIGFAHRRLAIVDLHPSGAQPMRNAAGTLSVTFNGEIYNYQDLRRTLEAEGYRFRSTSDTEVLLALYEREGERMLDSLHGMFAFALWDARRQKLFFARDRIGKKPFYYFFDHRAFMFASEIKALLEEKKPLIDWNALRLFFGLQYIPCPRTGFASILSLPPAHYGIVENGEALIRSYDAYARAPLFSGSTSEAAAEVRRLMEEAVRLRLIADVPVGAFLSGGVDSSIVVALMARQSSQPVQTFTMGFPSLGFDERAEARDLAKKLGTHHLEFEARPEVAAELVDELVRLYDSPYADSSSLPSWLLAREASHHVKTLMTGDGGDELFAGYRRYRYFQTALRLSAVKAFGSFFASGLEQAGKMFQDPKAVRFARTVRACVRGGISAGYAKLFTGSYFSSEDESWLLQPDFFAQTQASAAERFIKNRIDPKFGVRGALDFDFSSYLPDDLNVKMDRASMAHGLETRAPFLDQDLARFVLRLPATFLLERGKIKPLLRLAFQDLISPEIFSRPKRGFQVPLAEWFRTNLRPLFVERCLVKGSPLHQLCRPAAVQSYLEANDQGVDHGNRLWMLLVLATWLERFPCSSQTM